MERDELCGRSLGEFVIRERIGEGGFGAVYRCEQPLLGREAVVKVLHRRLRGSETALQRFLREARLASRLDHPYAAHVYAFGVEKDDGLIWIAMEMVHGTPLDKWLRDRGRLPLDQLVPFFERIAEVVHTAHEAGIVHRDIKPQNVMVIERAGRLLPKLLDLGIAKALDDVSRPETPTPPSDPEPRPEPALDPLAHTQLEVAADAERSPPQSEIDTLPPDREADAAVAPMARLTQANTAVGSPPYMAPEQWIDAWSAGPRADLYSLAVLAYEAHAGRRPFDAPTVPAYLAQHLHAPVPSLGELGTPALDRFFARALAKEQDDRYATALELAAALRVASGLSAETVAMPRLDEAVRDAWIADAPQPLAEAIATLDGARNPHQARDAAWDLVHGTIRYLLALALAARAQVRDHRDDPQLAELLRALRHRDLQVEERVRLLRLLVRPFSTRRQAHPLPALVEFAGESSADDARHPLDRVLQLRTSSDAGRLSDDLVRGHLAQLLPVIAQLLRATGFVLDHPLVIARAGAIERWTGLRRARRAPATIHDGAPADRQPVLIDRDGRVCLLLAPLIAVRAPTAGAGDELFVFDGRGRHGARMIAAPAGFEHTDPELWEWLGEHVVGDDEVLGRSLDDERAPYLGLTAFATADADRFVGREREIEAFVNRLRTQPLGVVVGASGAGKSSFVHAGVIPALPAEWRAVTLRPGAAPATMLASKLAAAAVSTVSLDTSPLVALASIERAGGGTLVVVVDQLEELVTLCHDDAERTRFTAMLAQLASSQEAPLRVICTVRDDFLMRIEALPALRARLASALTLLGNPSHDDLVRMIVEPARRAGYELSEPELAREMVDEVADRPGALALLSFTAARLWELRDRRFRQLSRNAYRAMGGVGGALGKHADDTFDALTGDDQRLARQLFRHLVTSDGTRAVLSPAELRQILDSPRADGLIEKLVAARLIVVGDVEGTPRVEIIHEALITAWPRLQRWIREDAEGARMRDQLRAAAKQWHERDRPKGLLWRDDALADLERWRQRPEAAALTEVEAAFAGASRSDAKRARRLRRALVIAAFVALIAAVGVLLDLTAEAREQRALAHANAARAASLATDAQHRLAEQSEEQGRLALLAGEPSEALVYLLAAIDQGAERDAALEFLLGEAMRPLDAQVYALRGHGKPVTSIAALGADRIVSTGEDGTLRIWNLATGTQEREIRTVALGRIAVDAAMAHIVASGKDGVARLYSLDGAAPRELTTGDTASSYHHPAFSPDGTAVATVHGTERALRIWDARTGKLVRSLPLGSSPRAFYGKAVSWSPAGDALATAGFGGELRDARTGALRASLVHRDLITGVAFSDDGRLLASGSVDRTAAIWDARTGALRARLEGHAGSVELVTFDPSGRFLLTGSRDLTVRIWDTETGRVRSVLDGLSGTVRAAAFAPDGATLVTATEAGSIDVWDVPEGRHLGRLEGHSEAISAILYVHDRVVTSSSDGTIRVWQPTTASNRVITPCPNPTTFTPAPSGDAVAIGCVDGTTHVTALDGSHPATLAGHGAPIVGVRFAADHRIITRDDAGVVEVWRTDGARDVGNPLDGSTATALAVAPDLATVYAAREREVTAVDVRSGPPRAVWTAGDLVEAIDVSPDGTRMVITTARDLDVIDPRTGTRYLHLAERPPIALFGATNEIAIATEDTVRRWDATGQPQPALQCVSEVRAISFDERAQRIATASVNGVVQLWSSQGTSIGNLEGHLGRVIDVVFDERGFVTSLGIDGTVRVWDPATSRLLAAFRSHHGTPYELKQIREQVVSSDGDGALVVMSRHRAPDLATARRVAGCLAVTLDNGRITRNRGGTCR